MDSIEQGTPQWIEHRKSGIGSSDCAAMMMLSKYKTIEKLWTEKVTGVDDFKGNFATQRGQDLEGVARDIYEFEYRINVRPRTFVHKRFEFIRYSSDGYNEELNYNVEFKCPMKASVIEEALKGIVPDLYMPQIQWAMLVTETKFIHYCTFDGKSTLAVTRVERSDKYIKALVSRARWFWQKVLRKSEITKEEKQKCLSLNKKLYTDLVIKTEALSQSKNIV